MTDQTVKLLSDVAGSPPHEAVARSHRRVRAWFAETAPLIRWDGVDTPLGVLHVASSEQGLCRVDLGVSPAAFLAQLDPLARTERDSTTLANITEQFCEYFANPRTRFDLPLDLSRVRPFQRRVLETIAAIPAGTVWTYHQVAAAIGKPSASRAVGHALSTNPLMIVLPCHRVIGSDGGLHGYRGGLDAKRRLLQMEGAL